MGQRPGKFKLEVRKTEVLLTYAKLDQEPQGKLEREGERKGSKEKTTPVTSKM